MCTSVQRSSSHATTNENSGAVRNNHRRSGSPFLKKLFFASSSPSSSFLYSFLPLYPPPVLPATPAAAAATSHPLGMGGGGGNRRGGVATCCLCVCERAYVSVCVRMMGKPRHKTAERERGGGSWRPTNPQESRFPTAGAFSLAARPPFACRRWEGRHPTPASPLVQVLGSKSRQEQLLRRAITNRPPVRLSFRLVVTTNDGWTRGRSPPADRYQEYLWTSNRENKNQNLKMCRKTIQPFWNLQQEQKF